MTLFTTAKFSKTWFLAINGEATSTLAFWDIPRFLSQLKTFFIQGSAKRSADFVKQQPGRKVKQEQVEISRNHVQAFIPGSVDDQT